MTADNENQDRQISAVVINHSIASMLDVTPTFPAVTQSNNVSMGKCKELLLCFKIFLSSMALGIFPFFSIFAIIKLLIEFNMRQNILLCLLEAVILVALFFSSISFFCKSINKNVEKVKNNND